jgi:hypothetical protein
MNFHFVRVIAPHVIEKVPNHSTGQISGVAAVYNRHEYLREKTEALYAWSRSVEQIVLPMESNVVSIKWNQKSKMKILNQRQ